MTKPKRHISPRLKASIAQEAMRGKLTIAALAAKHGVSPARILEWRKEADAAITAAFKQSRGTKTKAADDLGDDRFSTLDEIIRDSEFKEVVVLFADMVGSSLRARGAGNRTDEGHGDDEHHTVHSKSVQDQVISLMTQAVAELDGTPVFHEGDGIFALFGAPLAQEEYAVNACHAALRIFELVRGHAALTGENIEVRVGLCAGNVMAGGVNLENGAFGNAVNFGAHVEKYLAKAGEACISESTYHLVEGLFHVQARQAAYVKGALPGGAIPDVTVYILKGAVESATRFDARASRKLSTFVGREGELARLAAADAEVSRGGRRCFAVYGPAGVGKSRLVREFCRRLPSELWVPIELSGAVNQKDTPYAPLVRLLRAWCDVSERTDSAAWRAALLAKFGALGIADAETQEALLSTVGLLPDDAAFKTLEPAAARNRAHGALITALKAYAGNKALAIVAEDIQWMDGQSRAVLERLAADHAITRTLLIFICREEAPASKSKTAPKGVAGLELAVTAEKMALAPLGAAPATIMLNTLLGRDAGLETFKADIRRLTDGTPLFIEEIVRMMVDTGHLVGEPGNYRRAADRRDLPVPATVKKVFAHRIDSLRPRDKALLQAAAILGQSCAEAALAHLVNVPAAELRAPLLRLARAGLISTVRRPDGAWHSFNHALCQEAVYKGLMPERRRALHGRALRYFTALPERKPDVIEALAYHAVGARQWDEAIQYLQLACEAVQKRWANREAERIFDTGLKVLKKLPESPEKARKALLLRLTVLQALRPLGELDRVRRLLQEAEQLAQPLDDQARLPVYIQQAVFDWLAGRHQQGLAAAEQALAFKDLRLPQQVTAGFYRGMALHALGRFTEAIAVLRDARAVLTGPLAGKRLGWPGDPVSFCDAFLASALTLTGATGEARVLLDAAAAHARAIDHPYSIAIINDVLAEHFLETGNPAAAEPLLMQTIEICRAHELFTMHLPALARLALVETRCGKWRHARDRLRQAVTERLDTMGGTYALGYMLHAEAETNAAAGDLKKALAVCKAAEDRHRATGARAARAGILLFKADLLARLERPQAAVLAARNARAIAESCGMKPLVARCDLLLATAQSSSKSGTTGRRGPRDVRHAV